MREFKVVVLGPGGVGKSALTVQFISGKFVERYDPTVEDFYRKEIEVDGDPAYLEILDTAGTEQFASMRDLYIKNGQGFIIVYSLTSKQSFQDIKLIREQIIRVKGTDTVPIVLAANKCDVHDGQREVASIEGFELANQWSIPYVETSAKNSHIVNSLFTEIVKEMNIKSNLFNGNKYKKKKKKTKNKKEKLVSSNSKNNLIINSSSSSSSNNTKTNTISDHMSSLSNNSSSSQAKYNKKNNIGGSSGVLLDPNDSSSSCCLFSCIKRNKKTICSKNFNDLSHHHSNFIHHSKQLQKKSNNEYCSIL